MPGTDKWGQELEQRLRSRSARPAVVGLGYVGLPLLAEMTRAGFRGIGIDLSIEKITMLKEGHSYVADVPDEAICPAIRDGRVEVTTEFDLLAEADTIDICVPTPLRKTRDPDVSYIVAAADEIAQRLRPGQLVVLESTTYPGTTEELLLPKLEESGLKVGEDFFLAFSPERVDPGNKRYTTRNIPKVVGGVTPRCTELATLLFSSTVETVVPVATTRVAEMVKLLENTFRSVNIGLVNEIALLSDRMEIDVWEVIDAAATKPFGFMPFYPGPGLGGHCLPVDPIYLSWKARLHDFEARFIDLAAEINGYMPHHVVSMIADALNEREKSLKGSKVLVIGVAYKKEVSDMRESPALAVMEQLQRKGAVLSYCDPHVPRLSLGGTAMEAIPLEPRTLSENDCAVIITDHSAFDYGMIVSNSDLVVDTRNATKGIDAPPGRIERL